MSSSTSAAENDGGMFDGFSSGLNDALNIWGKYEQVKKTKSARGGDQLQAKMQPELNNGSATMLDNNIVSPVNDKGFKVDKKLLYISLGLLGFAFVLRMKGF